ncbi:MAG: hypothetical protein HC855_03035 [Rhizobiales bacterium]|nr:hypothetical protein [Hyphomicrobiales bacterium]
MAIIDGTTGNDPNLDGTATADTINGFGGADTMRGFAGDDTINPGASGSDTIDGGAGSDTVNLTGNFADYAISYSGANIVLTNGATVETITGVETITFAGQTVRIVGSGSELTTIQAAVNAAGNGDTILIQGGTYAEQVTIANRAGLTLAAATGQTVTIQAPATLVQNATSSSGRELHGVVAVVDSTGIMLDGIDIDGAGAGDTVAGVNPNFVGVVYRNSSGGLNNVDITGIRQSYEPGTTVSGQPILKAATIGFGVQVNNDTTLPFFMTGGTISDCQVVGAVFSFTDLDVSGVTIIGGGDQTLRTQNGIQAGNSTGTISGNTITDYGFAGFDPIYNSGIRGFDNTNLTISNNTITGSNDVNSASKLVGIFTDTSNSGITITGNTIDYADMAIIGTNLVSPDGYIINNNTVTNIDIFDAFYLSSGSVLFTPDENAATHSVAGTSFNDNLFGGTGTDTLTGLAGNDWTSGRGGDDLLSGGQGDDRIEGGDGVDTADYSSASGSGIILDLNILAAQSVSATEGSDTVTGIENVIGSALNDTLTGDGLANILEGRGGGDTLRGGIGNDTLVGAPASTV